MENRVYNFSAGPATLPLPVLQEAQRDLLCLPGAGASILEISHRSKPFRKILDAAKENIRTLLGLPENYYIVFLQGGASLQFAQVPMTLLAGQDKPASYLITGSWGKKAIAEAKRFGAVQVAWSGEKTGFTRLPRADDLAVDPGAAYLHFTSNETIQGLQFRTEPESGDVPLICDASSDFLSRPIDVQRYGLIYAGAQKNAGPSGVTIVLIRDDVLRRASEDVPTMLDYHIHAREDSLYNTPPTFGIYLVKLVTDWIRRDIGGLEKMAALNREKAQLLYDAIDQSDGFYRGCVEPEARSHMNVTFRLPEEEMEETFLAQAQERGLCELKGHRSVGGIRASLYNAMPLEGVQKLRDFMDEFRSAK
jgi:phosphoserine aminotransferase